MLYLPAVEAWVDACWEEKAGVRIWGPFSASLAGVSKREILVVSSSAFSIFTSSYSSFLTSFYVDSVRAFFSTFELSVEGGGVGWTGWAGFAGSGPLAELRFVSSSTPCAKRHLSPYLHEPFSRQFLHISYFKRRMTGLELWVEAFSESEEPEMLALPVVSLSFSLPSCELLPESDWEEGSPKLCSARGCLSTLLLASAGPP